MLERQERDMKVSRTDTSFGLDHHQPWVGLVHYHSTPRLCRSLWLLDSSASALAAKRLPVISIPKPWTAQVYLG